MSYPSRRRPYNRSESPGWSWEVKLPFAIKGYPTIAKATGWTLAEIPNYIDDGTNYRIRDAVVEYCARYWGAEAKWYDRKTIFAEYLYQTGGTTRQHIDLAYRALKRYLNMPGHTDKDDKPFVFSKNVDGARIPYLWTEMGPGNQSLIEMAARRQFGQVCDMVNERLTRESNKDRTSPDPTPSPVTSNPAPTSVPTDDLEIENEAADFFEEEVNPREDYPEVVEVVEDNSWRIYADELLRFINNARAMTEDLRDPMSGQSFDTVGFRWYLPAANLFVQGVPREIIQGNLIRTWPADNKRALWTASGAKFRNGVYVAENDYYTKRAEWETDAMKFVARDSVPGVAYITDNDHKAIGLALTFLYAEKTVWFIGPPGTGKTHLIGSMSEKLALETGKPFPYVNLSLTRATSPSAFYGKQRIDGTSILVEFLDALAEQALDRARKIAEHAKSAGDVTISLFERILRNGGIIGLDEADRADPNTMQMLNAIIAQRHFVNVVSQHEFDIHTDVKFAMMTNTEGTGANRAHNTADKMDDATVDRFRATRIFIGLDHELAVRKYWEIINAGMGA